MNLNNNLANIATSARQKNILIRQNAHFAWQKSLSIRHQKEFIYLPDPILIINDLKPV